MSTSTSAAAGPLPWQLGVPPVSVEVDCQGVRHRVTWRRGKLVLENHHLSAEEALIGLGGERCPCLELLAEWRTACGESVPLVLPAGGRGRPRRNNPGLPGGLDRPAMLGRLVRQQRHWVQLAEERGGAREALLRRLLGEFRDAVAASLLPSRQRRTVQRVDVKVRPLEPHADPSLEIEVGHGRVQLLAELSVSWLVQVWGWNLAAVDGGVALEVLEAADEGSRLAVTLLRWDEDGAGRPVPRVGVAWVARVAGVPGPDAEVGAKEDPGWMVVAQDGPSPKPRLWWSIDVRA